MLHQDKLCAKRANGVAQRCCGDYEANGCPGEQYKRGVKGKPQEWNPQPEPAAPQRPSEEGQDGAWMETVRLVDEFHSMRDADLAARAGQHHNAEKQHHAHHPLALVVRGSVRPTSATPTQISATPAQRAEVTFSRSTSTPSSATTAYPNEEAGMT